jgi:hypothetical protein
MEWILHFTYIGSPRSTSPCQLRLLGILITQRQLATILPLPLLLTDGLSNRLDSQADKLIA